MKPLASALPALLLALAVSASWALPEEYSHRATPQASAEDMNVLYGSVPRKSDEDFSVLASARTSSACRYFLVHRHSWGDTRSYAIIRITGTGVTVVHEGFDNPFRSGNVPRLDGKLPMEAAWELYRQSISSAG